MKLLENSADASLLIDTKKAKEHNLNTAETIQIPVVSKSVSRSARSERPSKKLEDYFKPMPTAKEETEPEKKLEIVREDEKEYANLADTKCSANDDIKGIYSVRKILTKEEEIEFLQTREKIPSSRGSFEPDSGSRQQLELSFGEVDN